MNDYDFGKYYRAKNRPQSQLKSASPKLAKLYKKASVFAAAGLIIFFAGLMTGISFQENRIQKNVPLAKNNAGIVESADISPETTTDNSAEIQPDRVADPKSEKATRDIRSTLTNPENEYIILAKRYSEDSKDRALYYASVLKKISKDENYDVIPSIRGRSIKLYVGPMKGRKNAEKMLARVKSLPEFTNSAILYKK